MDQEDEADPNDHLVHEKNGDQQLFWGRTPLGTEQVDGEHRRDRVIARRWG